MHLIVFVSLINYGRVFNCLSSCNSRCISSSGSKFYIAWIFHVLCSLISEKLYLIELWDRCRANSFKLIFSFKTRKQRFRILRKVITKIFKWRINDLRKKKVNHYSIWILHLVPDIYIYIYLTRFFPTDFSLYFIPHIQWESPQGIVRDNHVTFYYRRTAH